jgi:hypothetical protein
LKKVAKKLQSGGQSRPAFLRFPANSFLDLEKAGFSDGLQFFSSKFL